MMEYDWIQCHAKYGNVVIQPFGSQAMHHGVYVQHPDGTKSHLGSAETDEMNARVEKAIECWNERN